MIETRKAIRRAVHSGLGGEVSPTAALQEIYSITNDDEWWGDKESKTTEVDESDEEDDEESDGPGFIETCLDLLTGK